LGHLIKFWQEEDDPESSDYEEHKDDEDVKMWRQLTVTVKNQSEYPKEFF